MLARLGKLLRSMTGSARPQAGSTLPPIVDPKVPNKQQTQQSFSKRTKTTNADIRILETDRSTASLDLLSLRSGSTTKGVIRDLAKVSPDLSGARWAYQRMVVTRGFNAIAYNQDGTPNPQATSALQQLIARFNNLTDYTDGFSAVASLYSVAEQLTSEFVTYGAASMELVLDKARLPNRLQPISTTQLVFYEEKSDGYTYPIQRINGNEINLDIPTFFYESIDQDLLQPYSDSPLEAALQATLADAEFTNDLRRTIKRALHPRLKAKIVYDTFKKTIPPNVLGDPVALKAYHEEFIANIAATVNSLEPDDALVTFDTTEFDYLNNGNVTLNKEWEVIANLINAKQATGTHTPPAVLGHGSGSQNIASTETMLFVRYCEGIQNHVNSMLSRALTLGVRLLGYDVYVEFSFDRIDLRPDSELEAFRVMRQERILEQLSWGFISDEQASILLTGKLPPPGFKKLSGTQFQVQKTEFGNASSNTSNGSGNSNSQPQDQNKQTPTQSKGPVTRVK
jgi:hypothetical protein